MADSIPPFSSYLTTNEKPRFLLLYGSETGNAEAITADLVEQAAERGLLAERYELNETDRRFNIERERCVVMVTSTTGEGDPPANAVKFMKRVTKRTLPNDYLRNVNVTVLGLGDSNYSNFCNCAKTLWGAVTSLGAREFYPPGWADDATGLEVVVDPWIDGLWEPLIKTLKMIQEDTSGGIVENSSSSQNGLSEKESSGNFLDHVDARTVENESESVDIEPSCDCPLCHSDSLKGLDLTIPHLGQNFLRIDYDQDSPFDTSDRPILNGSQLPSSASGIVMATVTKATRLTHLDALKTALEIELDVSGSEFTYQPGDSFSVVSHNNADEVETLLTRLRLSDLADTHYILSIDPETKKRAATIPKHIPNEGTLRHTLTNCCDIRSVPKKAFLRVLVEATDSELEKRRLQELCSKEGQTEYAKHLRTPSLGLLDILTHFKTCRPPIERLLEHLTPLQPRPYSVSSSNLATPGKLSFVFNVIEIEASDGRSYRREGVCTGWLRTLTEPLRQQDLECQLENLSLKPLRVPIFMRTHNSFHLPSDPETPVVMIGPGTGVAPFIGFLQHRQKTQNGCKTGPIWLFFGCRNRNKDYLYENQLRQFSESGILSKLNVSFSRDENEPKYVQDSMQLEKDSLVEWLDLGAHVYVCGDAKNMARDVFEKFVHLVSEVKEMSEKDSRALMMTKRLKKYYHEDVWT